MYSTASRQYSNHHNNIVSHVHTEDKWYYLLSISCFIWWWNTVTVIIASDSKVKYKNGRVWTFIWENNWSFGSLVIPLSRYSLQERTIFLYSLKFQVFMEKTTDKISKGWHSDNFSTKTKFWSFLLFKEDIVGMGKLFGSGFRSFWSYWNFYGKQSDCFRMLLGEKETI